MTQIYGGRTPQWDRKKQERWTMLSSGMVVPLVPATSSYSRCVQVTDGGSLALRRCLCHTGRIYGERAPQAISPMAVMNWTKPAASLIVWLRRKAKMNPPHLRRVTCQSQSKRTSVCLFQLTEIDGDYQMKCVVRVCSLFEQNCPNRVFLEHL